MTLIRGMDDAIRAFGIFILVEFCIIAFCLVLAGAFTADPLTVISAVCTQLSITPWDLAVGIFIISSFFNFILMFWSAANV